MTTIHGLGTRFLSLGLGALGLCAFSGRAVAQDAPPAAVPAAPESTAAAPAATAVAGAPPAAPAQTASPPPPYSVPWQLRPLGAATAIRLDNTVALYENPMTGQSGTSMANMVLVSYKVTPNLAPLVRLGFIRNGAPEGTPDGTAFVNPVLGLTYAKRADSIRWALFGAVALPFGMGGGSAPDTGTATAAAAGIPARSAMDNAMFAVNYFTPFVGAGVGYVDHKLTVQVEATVLQLLRTRGEGTPWATDSARTNSTAGIHVGYFLLPMLSVGGELRYQRWLSTPTLPSGADIPSANKDTLTMAVGPRAHFAFGKGMWLRPGISYSRGLDAPLKDASYNMIQVDLPLSF